MTEHELHGMWASARWHIIVSQVAPTLLLAASVGFVMAGIGHMPTPIRLALALILLAGGVLGFAAQYSAGSEMKAIASDLEASTRHPLSPRASSGTPSAATSSRRPARRSSC